MKTGNVMIGSVNSRKIGSSKQVLIYDEIGPQLAKLKLQINNLTNKAKNDKWISALQSLENSLDKFDDKINSYDRKLGAISIV